MDTRYVPDVGFHEMLIVKHMAEFRMAVDELVSSVEAGCEDDAQHMVGVLAGAFERALRMSSGYMG